MIIEHRKIVMKAFVGLVISMVIMLAGMAVCLHNVQSHMSYGLWGWVILAGGGLFGLAVVGWVHWRMRKQ